MTRLATVRPPAPMPATVALSALTSAIGADANRADADHRPDTTGAPEAPRIDRARQGQHHSRRLATRPRRCRPPRPLPGLAMTRRPMLLKARPPALLPRAHRRVPPGEPPAVLPTRFRPVLLPAPRAVARRSSTASQRSTKAHLPMQVGPSSLVVPPEASGRRAGVRQGLQGPPYRNTPQGVAGLSDDLCQT